MKAVIRPSKADGTVQAPPSKSMAHRELICAGLSSGESIIKNISPSQDVLATLDCLKALGADFTYNGDIVKIKGADLSKVIDGSVLSCRECGSTLRFFIPIALLTGKSIKFIGSETLLKRPLSVYEELCAANGFLFERGDGFINVKGLLGAGEYEIAGNVSSQFISGLLFALPLAAGDSRIRIIPPIESRPYINMTLSALAEFEVNAEWTDNTTLFIKGNQKYSPKNLSVEGDYSNAAFLEALNLAGGSVNVTGLNENSLQGDKVYSELFERLKTGTPEINISDCPDLGPVLMAAASLKNGATFIGTNRLKIKESDRGEAMKCELEKFGIKMDIGDDIITVHKGELKKPKVPLYGHNDHRVVMALSVLATVVGGEIDGAEAVNKSFPDFFDKLKKLGIEVQTSGMDK